MLALVDAASGKPLWEELRTAGFRTRFAFSADGARAAEMTDHGLRLLTLDAKKATLVDELPFPEDGKVDVIEWPTSLAFSRDGHTVVAGSLHGLVLVFDWP
jgi:hypothetical protein